ncbi:hypothetical protein DSO57_1000505 [Entomophthora muscae]|uniref:Uncharacterized protein n=1 Tax=Entomophthora muscae TaxID=34485 RepID=A0ACC2RP48_9FUNG|nr:hypothetical protein DSO57_1000505 [Entomophthora muscae]
MVKHLHQSVTLETSANQNPSNEEDNQIHAVQTSTGNPSNITGLISEVKPFCQEVRIHEDTHSTPSHATPDEQILHPIAASDKNNHQSVSHNLKMKQATPAQVPKPIPSTDHPGQSQPPVMKRSQYPSQPTIPENSPILPENPLSPPKMPGPQGWVTTALQGAASSLFQGRPDEWYKSHFPSLKPNTDNVQ